MAETNKDLAEAVGEDPNYTLAGETADAYHLAHPDGSILPIAKEGLDDSTHANIQSLPRSADVHDNPSFQIQARNLFGDSPNPNDPRYQMFEEQYARGQKGLEDFETNKAQAAQAKLTQDHDAAVAQNERRAQLGLAPIAVPGMPAGTQNLTSNPSPASETAPQAVPFGPPQTPQAPTAQDPFAAAANSQIAGVQNEAKAQGDLGNAQAKAFGDYQQRADTAKSEYDKQLEIHNQQRASLEKDIADNKVDPDHYWANKSTGSKVMAAIAVFLGGAGGGQNQALNIIQNNIKKDIDSQIQSIGNKKTLLEVNLRETGNIQAAYSKTMDTLLSVTKARVEQAAALAQDPMAKAKAQQVVGAIKQQQAQLGAQTALLRLQSQASGGGIPLEAESPVLLSNKDYSAKRVVVGNQSYQANTPDEAKDLRKFQSVVEPIKTGLNELEQIGNKIYTDPTARARAKSIAATLIPKFNEAAGLTRLSEPDIKILEKQFTNPDSFERLVAGGVRNQEKLKSLEEDADAKYRSMLPGYRGTLSSRGITKPGFKR